jgi:hypothetical protein
MFLIYGTKQLNYSSKQLSSQRRVYDKTKRVRVAIPHQPDVDRCDCDSGIAADERCGTAEGNCSSACHKLVAER